MASLSQTTKSTHTCPPVLPRGSFRALPPGSVMVRKGETLSTVALRCMLIVRAETSAMELAVSVAMAVVPSGQSPGLCLSSRPSGSRRSMLLGSRVIDVVGERCDLPPQALQHTRARLQQHAAVFTS